MMWTRKEVKEKAKEALKRNYWKAVLVSLILIILGGGGGSASVVGGNASHGGGSNQAVIDTEIDDVIVLENEGSLDFNEPGDGSVHKAAVEAGNSVTEAVDTVISDLEEAGAAVFVIFGVVFVTIFIIAFAIIILLDVLVVNPLCVGAQRFMLKSVDGTGNLSELGFAFDHNYKNAVKTTFFRDLHILLGAICCVIPGIYMNYQYYMVDYILAENPDMPYKEVLACSKNMMNGQKWNAFVLDISFILWHMLSTLTCGILEIFYVEPYIQLTRASLYRRLNGGYMGENYRNAAAQDVIVDAE
ncbi:MAG: DUF975 family protein [Roseburia sp.]|nr:DUF975 family protein [Roseburia sp.]MCM1243093.1 DUF975 family protein [Roseburia sp.]